MALSNTDNNIYNNELSDNILSSLYSKLPLVEPDNTFYESVKGVTLVKNEVAPLKKSNIPSPSILNLNKDLIKSWEEQHASLIEASFYGLKHELPYRSIFPGPYIPTLNGNMTVIGDKAFSVFINILMSIKQRIPRDNRIKKKSNHYYYQSDYKPILRKITEPEESWSLTKIKCPVINGVNFPLPPLYEYEPQDYRNLVNMRNKIEIICENFCRRHLGKNKKRTNNDLVELLSYISAVEYLFLRKVNSLLIKGFDQVLKHFDRLDKQPIHAAEFLFEIEHALSYLINIRNHKLVCSGAYDSYWVDILKLPLENLVETELGDIQRILREVRTFFTLGWSPIIVHLDGKNGFNIDGTHRHYAILTVELLRRLKKANNYNPIRNINLNSKESYNAIISFKNRYKKEGLSLRECLRAINYVINSDPPWSYIDELEIGINRIKDVELKFVPVVYLPEWRARSVIKNLCDKGIALVGVPPLNIYIVGRSKGRKGIFIRGGYHGTDRQPMVWIDIIKFQSIS